MPDAALRSALRGDARSPRPAHPLLAHADCLPAARRTRDTLLAAARRLGG